MHSMTGFGRGTHTTDAWTASVEAASINRKQLEVVVNLPRPLQSLENKVRQATLPNISRGRVQLSIKLEQPEGESSSQIRINPTLAKSFENAFSELSETIGRPLEATAADFLRQPGIMETGDTEEIDTESAWQAIAPALEQAISNLNKMRATEGSHLKNDFLTRLKNLSTFATGISSLAAPRVSNQRDLLLKRLADLDIPLNLDDERLAKEVAIFADRCDISEEITRLDSHFEKFHQYLDSNEPAGRSLDFLCQELFREFNTIASKANDAGIAQTVVSAKTELEKLREQLQNIE
ncbi:MAG: YicC/YloC family endoribonuclease, partial [Luteolibacter sp.]